MTKSMQKSGIKHTPVAVTKTIDKIKITKFISKGLKMQRRTNHIEDLSRADLGLLAQLFFYHNSSTSDSFPTEDWLTSQTDILSSFPAHLLRPTSFLPKLAMNMPFQPPKAVLCSVHKPLNPFLTRRIFMQLAAETGLRVQRLITAAEREDSGKRHDVRVQSGNGDEPEKDMNKDVRAWLRRLTALNSLWMSPTNYRTKFLAMPEDERFERLESGCMACILAFIGGQMQALLDLRTSFLGRKKSGHESRLWGLVEAWSRRSDHADWFKEESARVGKLVMRERRRIRHRQRKQRREQRLKRNRSRGKRADTYITALSGEHDADAMNDEQEDAMDDVVPEGGRNKGESDERDFEGSIIDFYDDVAGADGDALHSAFRRPMACDASTGTFHQRPPQLPQPKSTKPERPTARPGAKSHTTFYTQSAYSQDVGLGSGFGGSSSSQSQIQRQDRSHPVPTIVNPFATTSTRQNTRDGHVAEKRAESYQKLVGVPGGNSRVGPQPTSGEAVGDHIRILWTDGAGQEEEALICNKEEERARDERVKKALADAYGEDRR